MNDYAWDGLLIPAEVRNRYPAVSAYLPSLNGERMIFLVRSDGEFVLAWDILGKPHKVSISELSRMRSEWPDRFFDDSGFLVFRRDSDVYTVGPWRRKFRGWKLGSLRSCSGGNEKVGEGPDALKLREEVLDDD